jgi:hypothetical protein
MPVVITSWAFPMVIVNGNCVAPLVGKNTSIPASRSENDRSDQDDRCKMIFIADCHTWGCASEPIQNLDKSYKVVGYVRLGAGVSALADTAS